MSRKLLALGALALVALSGCGGGDGGSGPAPVRPSLSLVADTARPGTMVAVALHGARALPDSLGGSVGGTAVAFMRVGDSAFAALVPELAAGTQAVRAVVGADTLGASLSVLPALAFADPAATIDTVLDALRALPPLAAPVGMSDTDWGASLAKLDSMVADARTQVQALSPADQLALARFLASLRPPAGAPGAMRLTTADASPAAIFGTSACDAAERLAARRAIIALGAGYVFAGALAAPSLAVVWKLAAVAVSGVAYGATVLSAHDGWLAAVAACKVTTQVDLAETDPFSSLRALDASVPRAATASPRRFFKAIAVPYYPAGAGRNLSSTEIPKSAPLAELARTLDGLYGVAARIANGIGRIAGSVLGRRIPSLPPRLSQLAPGASSPLALVPADVKIENVRPSSVSLASAANGRAFVLTSGTAPTADVPFTYDVVSSYDGTVRKAMSGLLRPFMKIDYVLPGTSLQGDRSLVTENGVTYGKVQCGGLWTMRAKFGDRARWEQFMWRLTYNGRTVERVEPADLAANGPMEFSEGDQSFGYWWWWTDTENNQPAYRTFTIEAALTYTDLVTGKLDTLVAPTITCNR